MDFSACGTASVAGCGSGGPRRYRGSKAAVRSELGKNLGRKAMRAGVKSVAAVVLAASLASPELAQETIKRGALTTLEGRSEERRVGKYGIRTGRYRGEPEP